MSRASYKEKTRAQPQRLGILLLITLALLGLVLMAVAGVLALFSEDARETKTTAAIEILLRDQAGYQHFLVFDRFESLADLSVGYRMEFWVDNFVLIDPKEVSRLVYFSARESWASPFEGSEKVDQANARATTVFHFATVESTLRSLVLARVDKVRMVMKSGDFLGFTVVDQDKLRQALREILQLKTPSPHGG